MNQSLFERVKAFLQARHKNRIWHRVLYAMGLAVVFVTTYMLILPAITMERTAICGREEHVHTSECYSQPDTEAMRMYACPVTSQNPIIHTHDANCYDESGSLICQLPEIEAHTHTDACYSVERVLICGMSETANSFGDGSEAFTDTDDTFSDGESHVHTDACYETRTILTCGKQELLPHTHDESCYDEAGNLICTIPEIIAHQHTDECFTETAPAEPELICGKEEHVHTEECYPQEEATPTPEPEEGTADVTPEAEVTTTPEAENEEADVTPEAEEMVTPEPEEGKEDDIESDTSIVMLAEGTDSDGGETDNNSAVLPVVSVEGSGTEYNSVTDTFTTSLKVNFKFDDGSTIMAGKVYTYNYPEGVIVPDDLLNQTETLLDTANKNAGTYTFVKNEDGTYSVQVVFSDTYIANEVSEGNAVTGFVRFQGELSKDAVNSKGDIVLLGSGSTKIIIPSENIKYPDDKTESYDISVTKSGLWKSDEDKLIYTVYVRTLKGTPEQIEFTDTITSNGGLNLGTPTVSVEKGTNYWYNVWNNHDDANFTSVSVEPIYGSGTISMTLSKLTATPNFYEQYAQSPCTKLDFYKVTYTYDLSGQTITSTSVGNKVNVSATDTTKGQTVKNEAEATTEISKDISHKIGKSGTIKDNQIEWVVTVNNNKVDIAGAKLTDDMLSGMLNTADVTVEPNTGYIINSSDDGKITDITFNATENGTNKNMYTITYYTPLENAWDNQIITNTATLDPNPSEDGDEKTATANVTVDGVKLDKSGWYNGDTGKIDWTITVNSGCKDITDATLTDTMFEVLSETDFTIEPNSGYEFLKNDNTITGIKFIKINDASNMQKYIIKYSTSVDSSYQSQTVSNTAVLSPGNDITGNPVEKPADVSIGAVELNKGGYYQNNQINWTITVNPNKRNIAGAVLTDIMFSKVKADKITILYSSWGQSGEVPLNEYTGETNQNGYITKIVFNAIGDSSVNTKQYYLSYYTEAKAEWDDRDESNDAHLMIDGSDISTHADVKIPGCGSVEKEVGSLVVSEDGKTGTISWTVTLNVPESGLPENTVIEDDVTKNAQGNSNTSQTMNNNNVVLKEGFKFYWLDGSGNKIESESPYIPASNNVFFVTHDGNSYTYQDIQTNENQQFDDMQYTGFKISFPEGCERPNGAEKLVFTYDTTVNLENASVGINSFYNYVKIGNKIDDALAIYHKAGVVKMDGNGQTGTTETSSYGELIWKVQVMLDGENHNKLTLTDTLPNGVIPDSISIESVGMTTVTLTVAENGTISGTGTPYGISGSYDSENGKITLEIINQSSEGVIAANTEFKFTFNCHADEDILKAGGKYTLENSVDVNTGEGTIGSSDQTQNWTHTKTQEETKVVSKSGDWDNTNQLMKYSVVINPEGSDLLEDGDTLTLTDTLTYQNTFQLYYPVSGTFSIEASLIQNRVKLYQAIKDKTGQWVKGEELYDWSWTYSTTQSGSQNENSTNTIIVNGIPDETTLIFEYAYLVSTSASDHERVNEITFSLPFNNTAELNGTGESDTSASSSNQWRNSSSSGSVTTDGKTYTFYKVEKGNYNVSLEGATFSVYRYNSKSSDYDEAVVKTYSTDSLGSYRITRQEKDSEGNVTFTYDTNTLYKVMETSPPEGYRLPDEVKTFYFYFSNSEDTDHILPQEIPSDAVDLSAESKTVYVENVKNTTDITVKKEWEDESGNSLTENIPDSITVQLYQTTSNTASGGSESGSGDATGVSYTAYCNFNQTKTGTFSNVSVGDTVKIAVVYTWNAGNYGVTPDSWTGVSDGTGVWSTTQNNNDTYTYTCKLTSNTISFVTGDQLIAIGEISCTLVSQGTASNSGGNSSADTGKKYGDPITLNSSNNWTDTVHALPLSRMGVDNTIQYYSYYFKETNVPEGYSVSYSNGQSGVQGGTITVTNQKNRAVTSVTVNKVWKDVNGEAVEGTNETLPDSIQVYLTRTVGDSTTERVDSSGNTGESAQAYTVTKENGWTLTIGNLPKTDSNGNEYSYSFEEVPIEGYTAMVSETDQGIVTISNQKQPAETDLTVEKVWKDKNGNSVTRQDGSVTVNLYRRAVMSSGSGSGGEETLVNVTAGIKDENNSYVYVQDKNGTLGSTKTSIAVQKGTTITIRLYCEYALESWANKWKDCLASANETSLIRIEEDDGKGYVFRCQVNEDTTIDVWKNWGSNATATVTIDETTAATSTALSGNSEGSTILSDTFYRSVTLSNANHWKYTFSNLPLTGINEEGNSVTYYYYVQENPVLNYTTTYGNNNGIQSGTITVTNTATDTPEYELPETGGPGTKMYTLGGLLLSVLAVLLMYKQEKRRREVN